MADAELSIEPGAVQWQVRRSCDFWLTCLGYKDGDARRVLRVDAAPTDLVRRAGPSARGRV